MPGLKRSGTGCVTRSQTTLTVSTRRCSGLLESSLALRQMDAPCAMIDTDLIVWSKPEFGRDIIAAHREDLNPDVYPPLEYFSAAGHILPGFSREVLPLNTAFFYVPDNDFKEFYTSQAVAFMKSAERCGERLRYMVFAEQRMAAMCADYTGTGVQTLLDKDALFFPQDKYTHLWGAKQQMRERPLLREEFIWRCIARILRDFPEYEWTIDRIKGAAR